MTGAHLFPLHSGCSALCLAFLLASSPARAAAILPTDEGTTWNYARAGAEPPDLTVRLAGREQRGPDNLYRLETLAGGEVTRRELVSIDGRGLLCHERIGADDRAVALVPPQVTIPGELKVGTAWQTEEEVAGALMRQGWKAVGEEEIVVPAGKFRAWRLRCEEPWPLSIKIERWFVPGTGVVKDVTTTRGPTGRLLSRVALALKDPPHTAPAPVLASTGPAEPPSIEAVPEATPPPESAAPTAGPLAAVRIALQTASAREGEAQTEFRADAPNIFVSWAGENLPADSAVRVAWIAEDVGDVAPPNFIVDQTETEVTAPNFGARFTLSRPKDGWAAGKYRVELYLNDELRETVRVKITD